MELQKEEPKNNLKDEEASSISNNRMEELRAAFSFFDRNGNGNIEADELGAVMHSLGYEASEAELRDMINEADIDGNEVIDFDEFVRMMEAKRSPEQEELSELREAFEVFDCDGNGFISKIELGQVMRNLGETLSDEDLNEMITEADKNGDGLIDFEEFAAMLSKK